MPPMPEPSLIQLDNDVHDIYGLIIDMEKAVRRIEAGQRRQGARLDQIEADIRGLTDLATTGFAAVADRLAAIEAKLDGR